VKGRGEKWGERERREKGGNGGVGKEKEGQYQKVVPRDVTH
jgi:hypothetical protein